MRPSFLAVPVLLAATLLSCTRTDPSAPLNRTARLAPVKIACVGDSITLGHGLNDNTYPEQLQRMLGDGYEVRNFGVSGATLLANGDKPYIKQDLYKQSLDYHPDAVVIMLGTNDSKPQNWEYKSDFESDYGKLVKSYQALPSKPRIWLVEPCPVTGENKYKIREAPVDVEIPAISRVANNHNAGLIDVHEALLAHPDDFPDTVHPNVYGATVMAATVYKSLTGKPYSGPSVVKESAPTP